MQGRRHCHGEVDVIGHAPDRVQGNFLRLRYSSTQVLVKLSFDVVDDERVVTFRVPCDVEMDLGVNVARHGLGLGQAGGKAVKTAFLSR